MKKKSEKRPSKGPPFSLGGHYDLFGTPDKRFSLNAAQGDLARLDDITAESTEQVRISPLHSASPAFPNQAKVLEFEIPWLSRQSLLLNSPNNFFIVEGVFELKKDANSDWEAMTADDGAKIQINDSFMDFVFRKVEFVADNVVLTNSKNPTNGGAVMTILAQSQISPEAKRLVTHLASDAVNFCHETGKFQDLASADRTKYLSQILKGDAGFRCTWCPWLQFPFGLNSVNLQDNEKIIPHFQKQQLIRLYVSDSFAMVCDAVTIATQSVRFRLLDVKLQVTMVRPTIGLLKQIETNLPRFVMYPSFQYKQYTFSPSTLTTQETFEIQKCRFPSDVIITSHHPTFFGAHQTGVRGKTLWAFNPTKIHNIEVSWEDRLLLDARSISPFNMSDPVSAYGLETLYKLYSPFNLPHKLERNATEAEGFNKHSSWLPMLANFATSSARATSQDYTKGLMNRRGKLRLKFTFDPVTGAQNHYLVTLVSRAAGIMLDTRTQEWFSLDDLDLKDMS
jgi:hypothetical protein